MAVSISLSITQNSQNVTSNTSNVTVKVTASWTYGSWNALVGADGTPQAHGTLKIDGTSYNFRSTFNEGHTTSGSQTIFTKTVNVSHNSDGTKTLNCSASYSTYVSSGTVSCSGSKTLTTIPRKSSLSVGNGTLGTPQTLTVTRQSTSFTHTIVAQCGSASVTICTKSTAASISFTPPIAWASQDPTGTSVSVAYSITTYNGNLNIGANLYKVSCAVPASVKPSCSLTVTDAMGFADKYGGFLKGLSKFKVIVTATPDQGSAITTYKTTANDSTYTESSFTTGVITKSGTLTISSTVTDKRKRTGTASKTVTVLNYNKPLITNLSVHRCNADGTVNDQGECVEVIFSSSVTSLNSKNTATYTLEYKKTSETKYAEIILDGTPSDYIVDDTPDLRNVYSIADQSIIFPADSGSSYNVRVTVTDSFNNDPKATTASTGFTIMHWLASGLGMAIGKIAELSGVLDIGFKTRFFGGILHPVLEPKTDLDDIRTPNTYVGANVATYNYANCPLTSGTFTLEVVGMGEEGQVKQRLTYCHKTLSKAWERIYYSSSWGEWVCVSDFDGEILDQPNKYMTAAHVSTLSEPISKQRTGIVLVFSAYEDGAQNHHFQCCFVPKRIVSAQPGAGYNFYLSTSDFSYIGTKYLYISDTQITGHANNNDTGTNNGVTYANDHWVLRYVIGV